MSERSDDATVLLLCVVRDVAQPQLQLILSTSTYFIGSFAAGADGTFRPHGSGSAFDSAGRLMQGPVVGREAECRWKQGVMTGYGTFARSGRSCAAL